MNIEEYIKNNRNCFDTEFPEDGHEDRFKLKLKQRIETRRSRFMIIAVSSAAALVLLLISLPFVRSSFKYTEKTVALTAEVQEVQTYYDFQLEQQIGEVEMMTSSLDQNIRKQVMYDVHQLKNDTLPTKELIFLSQEKQIAVIVEVYDARIEAIRQISAILRNVNDQQRKYQKS